MEKEQCQRSDGVRNGILIEDRAMGEDEESEEVSDEDEGGSEDREEEEEDKRNMRAEMVRATRDKDR